MLVEELMVARRGVRAASASEDPARSASARAGRPGRQVDLREARRLFYVGFTRARHEIHLMYSQFNPSRFVTEVEKRIAAD